MSVLRCGGTGLMHWGRSDRLAFAATPGKHIRITLVLFENRKTKPASREIPDPRLHSPGKFQTPISKEADQPLIFPVWDLLGIWLLGFGLSRAAGLGRCPRSNLPS